MVPPYLQFDFTQNLGKENAVIFSNPVDIITTNIPDEVLLCLEEVKKAVNNGFYAAGFVSYEASYPLFQLKKNMATDFPLLWFGIFRQPSFRPLHNTRSDYSIDEWKMKIDKETYLKNVNDILKQIHSGKIDQVNYTVPFEAGFNGDSFSYYERLKRAQRAKYCAYLRFDNFDVLSLSPELFFAVNDQTVTLKPMKGTIARGKSYEEDVNNRKRLAQSIKNKMENDMIATMMQKELERIADDTQLSERCQIEKYPTVYQLTSTIQGKLKRGIDAVEVFKAIFPSGSITGLPKRESIELIANYENEARGVYCGAIGYFTPQGEAMFNVPIRTLTIDKKTKIARYFAGGGITARSKPLEEFHEMLTKTKILTTYDRPFQLLETMLLENGEIFLETYHVNRLQRSADYFDIPFRLDDVKNHLFELKRAGLKGKWRIRLLVDINGNVTLEREPLKPLMKRAVLLAKKPIDSKNVFLYHKTTERTVFESFREQLPGDALDMLLWNELGEITEFTIGNVVIQKDGELFTPPVSSGLLPGTFRQYLLDRGKIKERKLYIEDLQNIDKMWLINSVRKWVKVDLKTE